MAGGVLNRRLAGKIMVLRIYKKGQGKYTRLCSAFAAELVIALGCLRLYEKLAGAELGLWTETMVPAGIFVVLSLLIFWAVNKPGLVNFMISAEGEVKKVSWSSRKEIAVSTFIVIAVVVLMAGLLGLTDLGFQVFFDRLLR